MIFTAYAIPWTTFQNTVYQGFVLDETLGLWTICAASELEVVQSELGLGETDRPWQLRASSVYDDWELKWGSQVGQAQALLMLWPTALENKPVLVDPVLGLPINRYVGVDTYRAELPDSVWLFNPWTGKPRALPDIQNDPQGEFI